MKNYLVLLNMGHYIGLGIGGGIVVLLLFWIIIVRGKLAKKKMRIDNNFSQIKIQCKKRFDLIPNLVEVVRSHAKQGGRFDQALATQQAGLSAQTPGALAAANEKCESILSGLLSESSASLKSNASFARLQDELARVEKAITISRQVYNDSVMIYNRAVTAFPNSIVAAMLRFKKAQFFDVTQEQDFKVSVDLFCKHCGTRNPASSTRCSGCGSGLN